MVNAEMQKDATPSFPRHGRTAAGDQAPAGQELPLAAKVAAICGRVADQGGGRLAMVHAVDQAFRRQPPAWRLLAAQQAHRCASLADMHDPDATEGPGDEIRSAFGALT